jgi:aspartyl-tRNA(Asn)/glutamyl-tRNA(Gln) amidotransferase subunit B
MSNFEFTPVVGLEVHAELLTQSKMFCACPVVDSTSTPPNQAICEVCTGMPGTLPVINQRAVEFALRVALALHSHIAPISVFARKNYFYPDLPKGYQISQYELPLAQGGRLEIGDGPPVRIRRVHLEEDTGKLFHHDGYSLVDYNRSGVPLLEIVSEPDLHSLEDIRAFAISLRTLLRYLDVNSGDMEKGVIRFEANVSVLPTGQQELGTRTEIKNLNSFRAMLRAVEFEISRQSELLRQGQPVVQETLGWDEILLRTVSQRGKEEAHDYRYFPEPDLPPLKVEPGWLEQIRASLPELPAERRTRLEHQYNLSPYLAGVLTAEKAVADFFEAACQSGAQPSPERLAYWVTGDVFSLLNESNQEITAMAIKPADLAGLVTAVESGRINAATAREILAESFRSGAPVLERLGHSELQQLSDPAQLSALIDQVLHDHPAQVEAFLAGKSAISNWLFGQVMKAAHGRANPQVVRQLLDQALQALDEHPRRG